VTATTTAVRSMIVCEAGCAIIEKNGDGDDYWQRVGSAWTNKDGSINLSMNALPLNGKLRIRVPKSDEESYSK